MSPTTKKITIITLVFLSFYIFNFLNQVREQKVLSDFDINPEEAMKVYFLDVGQGDATLIRTPKGNDILIDGGPDNTLIKKLGEYLPFSNRDIEYMILTHPDSDHIIGLVEVLNRYQVNNIIMTGVSDDLSAYEVFLNIIDEKNIPVTIVDQPQEIFFEDNIKFEIIYPFSSFENQVAENINNTSIAGRLIYASTSIMFTGDLENEEELFTQLGTTLEADVYKAGHHGANNANSRDFVEAIDPDYVVVSAGADNRFGHPHYRAIRIFERINAQISRTDQHGDILFITNGHDFFQY